MNDVERFKIFLCSIPVHDATIIKFRSYQSSIKFQKGFGVRTPVCMRKDLKEVKWALALFLDGCDVFNDYYYSSLTSHSGTFNWPYSDLLV